MADKQVEQTESGEESTDLNIYQRVHAMMKEVDYVQKIDKGGVPYSFVSHDAVTSKVRRAAINHRVLIVPTLSEYEVIGNRVQVVGSVAFVNIDDPKDRLTTNQLGFGVDKQDKGPGKAMSYLVKYAMLKVLGLETGDDPENDSIDHDPTGLLKVKDKSIKVAFQHYGVSSYQELTSSQAGAIIKSLEKSADKK